jgi:hypothetical protein
MKNLNRVRKDRTPKSAAEQGSTDRLPPEYQEYARITLILTAGQAAALQYWQGNFFKNGTLAHAGYWILMLALVRPNLVRGWLKELIHDCKTHGIRQDRLLADLVGRTDCYMAFRDSQTKTSGQGRGQ